MHCSAEHVLNLMVEIRAPFVSYVFCIQRVLRKSCQMMCSLLIRRGTGPNLEDRVMVKQHVGVGADVDDVDEAGAHVSGRGYHPSPHSSCTDYMGHGSSNVNLISIVIINVMHFNPLYFFPSVFVFLIPKKKLKSSKVK